jgi:flagellar basal-body rod protein FlgB
MQLFDTTQLGLEAALRGAAARQAAIAQNLANVNTPGYQRVDVDFTSRLQQAIADGDGEALHDVQFLPTADSSAAMRVDGNTVDLDREATEQAANGLHYQTIVGVMRARLGILETAMNTR